MEITFTDRRLRDVVAAEGELVRRYGKVCARRIGQRMQQLRVAETLDDLRVMAGRCHQLTGDRAGCLALDLEHPLRLVLRPTAPIPDTGLDWTVTAVTVIEIVDYHH